jgi:hypothetical protein
MSGGFPDMGNEGAHTISVCSTKPFGDDDMLPCSIVRPGLENRETRGTQRISEGEKLKTGPGESDLGHPPNRTFDQERV